MRKKIHVNPLCFDHGSPCCKSVLIKKRLLSRLAKILPPCDNMNPGEKAWVYWNNDPACYACCQWWRSIVYIYFISSWNCQKLAAKQPLPGQTVWTVHHSKNHTFRATLLQLSWAGLHVGPLLYSLRPQWYETLRPRWYETPNTGQSMSARPLSNPGIELRKHGSAGEWPIPPCVTAVITVGCNQGAGVTMEGWPYTAYCLA